MVAQTTVQNVEATSGSEQDGPIWGYHFVPNEPARSITSDAAIEFLAAPGLALPGEFLWLHFSLPNVSTEPWLRRYRVQQAPSLVGFSPVMPNAASVGIRTSLQKNLKEPSNYSLQSLQ
jgi:hypothetical protein